jgi:hypothetical protein
MSGIINVLHKNANDGLNASQFGLTFAQTPKFPTPEHELQNRKVNFFLDLWK